MQHEEVMYARGVFAPAPPGTCERYYGFHWIVDEAGRRVARIPTWAVAGMLDAGRAVLAPPGTEVPERRFSVPTAETVRTKRVVTGATFAPIEADEARRLGLV